MPSEEMEGASPPWGSHPHGAKGLWALGGPTVSTVVGHTEPAISRAKRWVEAVVKPGEEGAYVSSALKLQSRLGRSTEERPRLQTGPGKSRRPAL